MLSEDPSRMASSARRAAACLAVTRLRYKRFRTTRTASSASMTSHNPSQASNRNSFETPGAPNRMRWKSGVLVTRSPRNRRSWWSGYGRNNGDSHNIEGSSAVVDSSLFVARSVSLPTLSLSSVADTKELKSALKSLSPKARLTASSPQTLDMCKIRCGAALHSFDDRSLSVNVVSPLPLLLGWIIERFKIPITSSSSKSILRNCIMGISVSVVIQPFASSIRAFSCSADGE
mmetsp:Transcript_2708/g.5839  ORF Transcript_2708/g.5839 Transcript_2708/m.5839 type:complete len:232 (-) Transcript_2708:1358-2053(-)